MYDPCSPVQELCKNDFDRDLGKQAEYALQFAGMVDEVGKPFVSFKRELIDLTKPLHVFVAMAVKHMTNPSMVATLDFMEGQIFDMQVKLKMAQRGSNDIAEFKMATEVMKKILELTKEISSLRNELYGKESENPLFHKAVYKRRRVQDVKGSDVDIEGSYYEDVIEKVESKSKRGRKKKQSDNDDDTTTTTPIGIRKDMWGR